MITHSDPLLKAAIDELRNSGNPDNVAGMARYGINPESALGVKMPIIRAIGKRLGRNHDLAGALWESGIHEARILASVVDEPDLVTSAQMDRWIADFNSWDLCDQCCGNLFDKTPFAYEKALQWSTRSREFEKRASFALMAWLAVHDRAAVNGRFAEFLPVVERESRDQRTYVRKAIDWSLRQIGKRNLALNQAAITVAGRLAEDSDKTAAWIGRNSLRELTSSKLQERLKRKASR